MAEPLGLLNYFPAVADQQWQDLISKDLSWIPIEGITIQPYYRRGASMPSPAFDHHGWCIRADVALEDAMVALDSGAEALGMALNEAPPLLETLPIGRIPLYVRGKSVNADFIQSLCTRAYLHGYEPSQLRGAAIHPEERFNLANLEAAQGTGLRTRCIDLELWHDQGATHVQEVACALAELSDTMSDTPAAADHVYFRVAVGERTLIDIARLRALRLCATEVLRAYQVQIPKIHLVGVPSDRYKSSLDPDTHLIRQTLQATAAILGGCNVVVCRDISRGLRVQQILRHEAKISTETDATAGAWMIEYLTDAVGQAAWKLFQTIESKGGLRRASTWIEKEIQRADMERKISVYSGDKKVVGVNTYLSPQIENIASHPGSIAAPLEKIRLRANTMNQPVRVQLQGPINPWLQCLFHLCACSIHSEGGDITVTQTLEGFLAENRRKEHVWLTPGESLPSAADRFLNLVEDHAA